VTYLDVLFAVGGEFRPVPGDRRERVQAAAIDQPYYVALLGAAEAIQSVKRVG
jgi:hypothetical protein